MVVLKQLDYWYPIKDIFKVKENINDKLGDWLNTRKEGEKSLNGMQGNLNLPEQAIIKSLLHFSFQR